MKITAKQYAQALYQSTSGKTAVQVKVAVENLVKILVGNNCLSLADKIVAEFLKIYNLESGIFEAEVISARDLSKETIARIKSYLEESVNTKSIVLKQTIDENILGGLIIKYEDKVLDGSMKATLADFKEELIK